MSVRLPEKFIERMKEQLPENEWEAFFAVYEKKPFKGVRVNPLKGDRYALKLSFAIFLRGNTLKGFEDFNKIAQIIKAAIVGDFCHG